MKNNQEILNFCKEEVRKAQAFSTDLKEGYWLGKYVGLIEAYENIIDLIEENKDKGSNPFIYTPNRKEN